MRVNVVCRNYDADRVLPRYSRYLSRVNGWGISQRARPDFDVNLYMAYFEYLKNKGFQGPVAAYFTHYEPGPKGDLYDKVAQLPNVHLRIAMNQSQIPHLSQYGPTVVAPLPLDVEHFPRRKGPRAGMHPKLGFSGYVYKSGRKGEYLARRIFDDFKDVGIQFMASGRGWPCPTKMYKWDDLPKFFQLLDLYVCTSTVEGGPMTTLEALATGVPVVIPKGVGIHDEIRQVKGIWRYEAGNYESLRNAVVQGINNLDVIDRDELRSTVVDKFNINNFCRQVKFSVQQHFGQPETAPPKQKWTETNKSGIYMVAFGEPARACAVKCITACKSLMRDLPVALCADTPLYGDVQPDIFIEQEDLDIGGRIAKLAAFVNTPPEWEYVLYLDVDTVPQENLGFIFETLNKGWELVICKDMAKYAVSRFMLRADNKEEAAETWKIMGTDEVMQYNGGVFAFRRSERVKEFFKIWQEEWHRWGGRDQGALLRALYKQPMQLYVLGNEWNASDRYSEPVGEVAVWHYNVAARRWAGKVWDRLDSEKAWGMVNKWKRAHGNKSPRGTI